jgi:hypothetical protein
VAGGITTVNVMPGSGLLVGGQTLYLKLREGNTIDDLLITNAAGRIAGGLKMANGTNPQRDPPFPGTRGKAAALVREKFIAAREYRDKIDRANGDADLALYDGDPFEYTTRCVGVLVNGVLTDRTPQ